MLGGRGPERLAEPVELFPGQEALVHHDLEAGHAPARVASGGMSAPCVGEIEHLHQDVDRPVGHGGHVMEFGMEGQDVLVFDVRDEALCEGRHDVLAKHESVVGDGQRLAVHHDMFALVALGDKARAAGQSPGFADIAIAATAGTRNLTILTRNLRHFTPLGVAVMDPYDGLP